MTDILFVIDEHDIAFLKGQWDDLLSFYSTDPSIKDNAFAMLEGRYSEKSRFYHNLSHVKALLNLLATLDDKIQHQNAIRFSTWFHDVVYDTKRNDNEEESARLTSEMLGKLQVSMETIEFVMDLILATKSHSGKNLSADAQLFLDADLSILGMHAETYQRYSQAIRAEYSWVPEPVYRSSRRKLLESFLARESIYFTDEMKERFEEQARKNIHGEIQSLRAE